MKKAKNQVSANYLERIPVRSERIAWSADDKGIVTLEVENRGLFNTIAQKLFRKPRVSHIHLDEIGSAVWPLIDGESDLLKIGEQLEAKLGEKAHPTYERLAKFIMILYEYGFISFVK